MQYYSSLKHNIFLAATPKMKSCHPLRAPVGGENIKVLVYTNQRRNSYLFSQ